MKKEVCGHFVHRLFFVFVDIVSAKLLSGPIVDRDNFFEKYRSKYTKDEKRYFEMVYQQRKSGHLANQVDHSDQKVL